jgi:hypothetical protein
VLYRLRLDNRILEAGGDKPRDYGTRSQDQEQSSGPCRYLSEPTTAVFDNGGFRFQAVELLGRLKKLYHSRVNGGKGVLVSYGITRRTEEKEIYIREDRSRMKPL